MRDDPVPALEHLARDLSVAALIRLEQVEAQTGVEQDARQEDQPEQGDRPDTLGGQLRSAGKENVLPQKRNPAEQ
jgi:hypothetical protein